MHVPAGSSSKQAYKWNKIGCKTATSTKQGSKAVMITGLPQLHTSADESTPHPESHCNTEPTALPACRTHAALLSTQTVCIPWQCIRLCTLFTLHALLHTHSCNTTCQGLTLHGASVRTILSACNHTQSASTSFDRRFPYVPAHAVCGVMRS